MDFIAPNYPLLGKKKYIIFFTDYLKKWVETKVFKATTKQKVVDFLRENIFYMFGYPREVVIDQGEKFTSNLIKDIMRQHIIKHKKSNSYHPQANGQA